MNRLASAALAASLFLMAGCAVGSRYKRPDTPVSAHWSAPQVKGTNQGEPVEQWWKSFHDPEFDRLVERAVEANLDVKLATARVAEARAARGIARSAL